MKKSYQEINKMISEEYGCLVPDYDLRKVLELLAAFEPNEIALSVIRARSALKARYNILIEEVGQSLPEKKKGEIVEDLHRLEAIFKSLIGTFYDKEKFSDSICHQIENKKGFYANEDTPSYGQYGF